METIKVVFSMMLTAVVVGGLYIGSALLGYFLAVLSIALVILGTVIAILCGVYCIIYSIFESPSKK